jgi:hypothetical protein
MSKGFKASILLILFGILAFNFLQWHPSWNCTKDEINIKTGQGRHSRYIAFIRISEKTYDTPLSEALTGTVEVAKITAWQTVNTFSPPSKRYSPHYRFHGALHQAGEAGLIFDELRASPERKAKIAGQILTRWQTTGGDDGVRGLLCKLWEETTRSLEPSAALLPRVPQISHSEGER